MLKTKLLQYILVSVFFAIGIWIRIWAAPYSAGVDMPQFWAFAKVFAEKGFAFYNFAGAELDVFPYKFWSYNYTPVWLIILKIIYLALPPTVATTEFLAPEWRLGLKMPLMISDLLIGVVLFKLVPGVLSGLVRHSWRPNLSQKNVRIAA